MTLYLEYLYAWDDFVMVSNFTKGSEFAAGFDLCSNVSSIIPAGSSGIVGVGVCVELPAGSYGRIAPRSGLAARHFISVGGGVVDLDYTGELKVILFNHGPNDFYIERGDRVAQLIVEQCYYPKIGVVDCIMKKTERGSKGFGSSGV